MQGGRVSLGQRAFVLGLQKKKILFI